MTVRVVFNEAGPTTQFLLDVDYIGYSVDGNYSILDVRLRNINTGTAFVSWYGGAGTHVGSIDGVGEFARRQVSSGFLPKVDSGAERWNLYKRVHIPHNADGTREAAVVRMSVDYSGITREGSYSTALPAIPRATSAEFRIDSTTVTAFDAGSPLTVYLPRASSAFTHDVTWEFGPDHTGTIGTGLGVSTTWTPPLSALEAIPSATQAYGSVTTVTKNGSTVVGSTRTQFTLRAPASVVPVISALTVTDDNPDVASLIGGFVQGQSRLKADVTAAGAYGSTISSAKVTVDGQTITSGQSLPLPTAGTRVVAAAVTDSRGRTASTSGNVQVLPYDVPQINDFTVTRATSAGVPSDVGSYLQVTLDAAVSSLVVGSQKNAATITLATRPRGGSVWTDRNVITPGLTYDTSVLVSGGGIFATTQAWDVRVTVKDKLASAQDFWSVSTTGAILDATPTKQALGKMVEESDPDSQIQGPGRLYGAWDVDGRKIIDAGDVANESTAGIAPLASQAQVNAGTDPGRIVTPATLRARPAAPVAMAAGRHAGGSGFTAVNFPSGRFTQPPIITCQVQSGAGSAAGVAIRTNAITATSFQFATTTVNIPIEWTAIQMTAVDAAG